jgi:hypothetical protein
MAKRTRILLTTLAILAAVATAGVAIHLLINAASTLHSG